MFTGKVAYDLEALGVKAAFPDTAYFWEYKLLRKGAPKSPLLECRVNIPGGSALFTFAMPNLPQKNSWSTTERPAKARMALNVGLETDFSEFRAYLEDFQLVNEFDEKFMVELYKAITTKV